MRYRGQTVPPDETSQQIELVRLLRKAGILVFHVPNEGKRSKTYGAKLKRMGVLAGVPDLFVFANGWVYAIEMKAKNSGKASAAQRKVMDALYKQGDVLCAVCHGYEAALDFLKGNNVNVD